MKEKGTASTFHVFWSLVVKDDTEQYSVQNILNLEMHKEVGEEQVGPPALSCLCLQVRWG